MAEYRHYAVPDPQWVDVSPRKPLPDRAEDFDSEA